MTTAEALESADLASKLSKSFDGLDAEIVLQALVSLLLAGAQARGVTKKHLLEFVDKAWDHMEQAVKQVHGLAKAKA